MAEARPPRFPRGALFDLDGTLLDSAPDMVATVNRMRAARAMPAITLAELRPHVSRGARAMCAVAFPGQVGADGVAAVTPALVEEFLEAYGGELGRHGAAFDGIDAALAALDADGVRWGIVTNKPERFARALLPSLGWQDRCAVLVGGDTLAERKPHPLPLLHAAAALGLAPGECVYVGDDARDIAAARAAGMPSIAALWGYRVDDDAPASWQADRMLDAPGDLADPAHWP